MIITSAVDISIHAVSPVSMSRSVPPLICPWHVRGLNEG
jgi:hypothetical protein